MGAWGIGCGASRPTGATANPCGGGRWLDRPEQYADYGPTGWRMLARYHGMTVSRETLRKRMSQEQLWKPRRARSREGALWRPRRELAAESWCNGTPANTIGWKGRSQLYLVAMIDDATSELTARFALHSSTAENMRLLWRYIAQHGRPRGGSIPTKRGCSGEPAIALQQTFAAESGTGNPRSSGRWRNWGSGASRRTRRRPERSGAKFRHHARSAGEGTPQSRTAFAAERRPISICKKNSFRSGIAPFARKPGQRVGRPQPLRKEQQLASILSHMARSAL